MPYGGPAGGAPRGQEQGLAITSLILGLAGCFIFPFLPSIAAIITGVMARNKIKENPQRYGGHGMATAGMWLGIAALVLHAIALIFYLGVILVAIGYCEENPDDPECQDGGFAIAPEVDQPPSPAWSWIALPLVAVRRRASPAV